MACRRSILDGMFNIRNAHSAGQFRHLRSGSSVCHNRPYTLSNVHTLSDLYPLPDFYILSIGCLAKVWYDWPS